MKYEKVTSECFSSLQPSNTSNNSNTSDTSNTSDGGGGTPSWVWAVVGSVLGCAALVAVGGAFLLHRRRKQQQQQAAAEAAKREEQAEAASAGKGSWNGSNGGVSGVSPFASTLASPFASPAATPFASAILPPLSGNSGAHAHDRRNDSGDVPGGAFLRAR